MVVIEIRDVPDELVDILRWCAESEGMSLEAYLRQELIKIARQSAGPRS